MELAFVDLLNSDWHDYRGSGRHEDRLDRHDWLADFLRTWGFEGVGEPGAAEVAGLRSLRTLLRGMVEELVAGRRLDPQALDRLNEVMGASPLVNRIERTQDGYSLRQVSVRGGWDGVLAAIVLSFADTLAHHDPSRLRICDNPDCGWFFYDESKNRTRRWCESGTCGNLVKVRRHRARAGVGTRGGSRGSPD